MTKIALIGAGGKVGRRLVQKLKDDPEYLMFYVEKQSERLKEYGVTVSEMKDAVEDADYVVLAVPDRLIQFVSKEVTQYMKEGAVLMTLDPAATYSGAIEELPHLKYVVLHPNHPSVFTSSSDPEVTKDYWGGVAPMDMVCTLVKGEEADKKEVEILAKKMFTPVNQVFWMTAEQMCLLEPGVVELVTAPLFEAMREAMERIIEMGVPREAAHSFVTGHLRPQLHTSFGDADPDNMSDGAKAALKRGMSLIMKPGWKEEVLNVDFIKKFTREIADFHE
ncbi:phosphogluconate dehydrogenase C-terminal domain-containing protein [Ruminococcus gauvreauii]|uniref:NAD(P)-binding domain-containing protein n=1 Tax=Ruminococcus gauvreauii TaxID=438033 RepID=A0ABY5VIM5_9FIRM|nr:phosphogluconate dehydrogenase C-terminal domain-containing protein [Ruminococcus gauvreauii]UWP59388.1 NAD(P)-binding domain-containing protein [Ruminococcus gauvreauii]